MFTTSGTFNGAFGGLGGADGQCAAAAAARGLPGTYLAYLGATGLNAPSRFTGATGWVRTDGRAMINSISEFGTGTLPFTPSLDEGGNDLAQSAQLGVWTATDDNTNYVGQNCNKAGLAPDWSDALFSRTMAGVCNSTTSTLLTGESFELCSTQLHLYCFGIDRRATVP
jgi:hypothetical protein